MKRRQTNAILIALAAIGGGVVAYGLPVALLERGAAASGLSEMLPLAAPPLGDTARHLFVAVAALVVAALVAAVLPWSRDAAGGRALSVRPDLAHEDAAPEGGEAHLPGDADGAPDAAAAPVAVPASGGNDDVPDEMQPDGAESGDDQAVGHAVPEERPSGDDEDEKMTFALSKLSLFGRGEGRRSAAMPGAVPVLRRSDAHPDAPPRPPLFARRDLDAEGLPPVEPAARDQAAPQTAAPDFSESAAVRPAAGPVDETPVRRLGRGFELPDEAEAVQAARPVVREASALSMPHAPEPLSWETIQQEMDRMMAREPAAAPQGTEPRPLRGALERLESAANDCSAADGVADGPVDSAAAADAASAAVRDGTPGADRSNPAPTSPPAQTTGETVSLASAFAPTAPAFAPEPAAAPASAPRPVAQDAALPSIAELTERLARGLARRGAREAERIEDDAAAAARRFDQPAPGEYGAGTEGAARTAPSSAPFAPPADVPSSSRVSDDLQDALAALRAMASRPG